MSNSLQPWTAAHQASLSFAVFQSLLKLMSNESVMPSNHLILSCPLSSCLLSFSALGSFPMSQLFTSGDQSIGASASVLQMTGSRLISFKIDWSDLLDVQGTLKSLLQYHNSKASILQCLAFYRVHLSHLYMTTRKTIALTRWRVQLSYLYMTTGKTIALTRWTFVSKVMSLLFSTLSRFATAFLPSSIF